MSHALDHQDPVTITAVPKHFLTHDRIDALVRERAGVRLTPHPGKPYQVLPQLHEQLSLSPSDVFDHPEDPRVQQLVEGIDRWDSDEAARQREARAIMRTWDHVTLKRRDASGDQRWLGPQQWTWQAHLAALTHRDILRRHKISPAAFRRFVAAFAYDTRPDGLYMAGLENSIAFARMSSSTFHACLSAAGDLGLVQRQFAGRLLDRYERGVVIAAGLPHLTRWRSVYQLQHRSNIVRPSQSESPRSGPLSTTSSNNQSFSTATSAVDNRATRGSGPTSSATQQKKKRKPWKQLDPAAVMLFKDAQRLSPIFSQARLGSVYPHLLEFARAGYSAGDLLDAIDRYLVNSDRKLPTKVWHPARWIITTLRSLTICDARN